MQQSDSRHVAPGLSAWQQLGPIWQACMDEAWQAALVGSIPIGALVTDGDGRILTRGRNHIRERHSAAGSVHGSVLAHAELNALIDLRDQPDELELHTCNLYTTTEPCPLCMGALYMSGLRGLYYASRDPRAGSANMLGATPYLSRKPIRVTGPACDWLETLIAALGTEDAFRRGSDRTSIFLAEVAGSDLAHTVDVGEAWHQSGLVEDLRRAAVSPEAMVNRLFEHLGDRPA